MRRRGAFNLSIEMVIVLVIAVIFLGLMIAFVRGVFENVPDILPERTCGTIGDSSFDRTSFTVRASSNKEKLEFCVKNDGDVALSSAQAVISGCIGTDPEGVITTRSLDADIPVNSVMGYRLLVDTTKAHRGTYVCNLEIQSPDGKIGPVQASLTLE